MTKANEWLREKFSNKENVYSIIWSGKEAIYGELVIKNYLNLKSISIDNDFFDSEDKKKLTSLIIKNCPNLEVIICVNQNLDNLSIKGENKVGKINCKKNKLTNLKLENCHKLIELNCANNSLKSVELKNNKGLIRLDFQFNNLTNIDLSSNEELEYLICANNNLNNLNLSKNKKMLLLNCQNNELNKLDLSSNDNLIELECFSNKDLEKSDLIISEKIDDFSSYPLYLLIPKGEENFRNCVDKLWGEMINKLFKENGEMTMIEINDLKKIVDNLSINSVKDKEFLSNFINLDNINSFIKGEENKSSLRFLLRNISDQILARCLIVRSRLIEKKIDEKYEKEIERKRSNFQRLEDMYKRSFPRKEDLLLHGISVYKLSQLTPDSYFSIISDLPFIKDRYKDINNYLEAINKRIKGHLWEKSIFLVTFVGLLTFTLLFLKRKISNNEKNTSINR